MTPDDHAKRAESLLETSEGLPASNPTRASHERRAIAHAALSLRAAPKPARKPAPKKTTTKRKEPSPAPAPKKEGEKHGDD